MRIAELQRWVCAEAGEQGWIKVDHPSTRQEVAVIGGGPSALSCAYYLTLEGYKVHVFAPKSRSGDALWVRSQADLLLEAAVRNDVHGVMSLGFIFKGKQVPGGNLDLSQKQEEHYAIYIADAGPQRYSGIFETWLGDGWRNKIDPHTGRLTSNPKIFIGEEYILNGVSVVEAVACGRKAACSINRVPSITNRELTVSNQCVR